MPTPTLLSLTFLTITITITFVARIRVHSLTPPSEIAALKAFRAAIEPSSIPAWSCLASWDFSSTADPCARPRRDRFTCGLTCAGAGEPAGIVQIVLDPVGYSGSLTPSISMLRRLVTLDLSDNAFSGHIPPAIGSLTRLKTLNLRSNSFSGQIPGSIRNMRSIQTVDLSRNRISGVIPAVDSLKGLSRIDLSYNRLVGPIPNLPSGLIELVLRGNLLSGSIRESVFGHLDRLSVVDLGSNRLAGALQHWFFLLPALQQVDLANNNLTRVEIKKPNSITSELTAVDLSFNLIAGGVAPELASYPFLSSLSLRHNRLRGAIPGELGRKKSLRRLFLDGNFLTGDPPQGFFSGKDLVAGSFGDNCLRKCPASSRLCSPEQKPDNVCRRRLL